MRSSFSKSTRPTAKSVFAGGTMNEMSKRDWLLVILIAFVVTGTVFVILYWLYQAGWCGEA